MAEFETGDIILEISDDDEGRHALLWVADTRGKHIVHSKDLGTLTGVVQQSVGALAVEDEDDEDTEYVVFRCTNPGVAWCAAQFAVRWATRSDDPLVRPMIAYAQSQDQTVRARTPFGRRGDMQTNEDWGGRTFVRAVRAWARGHAGSPLVRRKGVSCSQFITYCYQAAIIEALSHAQELPIELWKEVFKHPQLQHLKKHNRYDLVHDVLAEFDEPIRNVIPPAFRVDAKTRDADSLYESLKDDSLFQRVGEVWMDDRQRPQTARIADG